MKGRNNFKRVAQLKTRYLFFQQKLFKTNCFFYISEHLLYKYRKFVECYQAIFNMVICQTLMFTMSDINVVSDGKNFF